MAGLFNNDNSAPFGPFTNNSGGSQRDLANAIFSVDAKNTPLVSMIPKAEGVINTTYEFPVDKALSPKHNATDDSLAAGDLTESNDFENALSDYSIIQNNVQWFRRASLVGKLAESASNLAGAPDIRATSIRKQLEAIKRDMEVRLCSDTIRNSADTADWYSGNNSTAPYTTRSLGAYIDSSNTSIPSDFQTPSGSIYSTGASSALTEANVQDVLQSIYEQTGVAKELTLLCGVNLKKQFRNFTESTTTDATNDITATRIRTLNQDASDRSIISTVDVFEGDFGTLSLVPTLWNAKSDWAHLNAGDRDSDWSADSGKNYGYVLDMDFLELRFHELPSVTPLPNLGAGERYEISAIAGLSVLNPLGFGAFKHLS